MKQIVTKKLGLNLLFLMFFSLSVYAQERKYRKPVVVVD